MRVGVLAGTASILARLAWQCAAAGYPPAVHATPLVRYTAGRREADPAARLAEITYWATGTPVVAARADELPELLAPHALDVLVTHGYPTLLPTGALSRSGIRVLNLHPARLPELRGPAPVVGAILRGLTEVWGTAHLTTAAYNAGPVVLQRSLLELPTWCTRADTHNRIVDATLSLVPEALEHLANNRPTSPQDHALATHAPTPDRTALETVDLREPADVVRNRLRAAYFLGRWPVHADVDGRPHHLGRVHPDPAPDRSRVECGNGTHLWTDELTAIPDGFGPAG